MDETRIFGDAALATLRNAYPETPTLLDHRLADHPLLSHAALTDLALAMRPIDKTRRATRRG
jgi:hypothetical protein